MKIDAYLWLPRAVARRFAPRSLRDEAESAGFVGLAKAARTFDPALGNTERRWAYACVQGAVHDLVRSWSWLPRRVASALGEEARLVATPLPLRNIEMLDYNHPERAYLNAEAAAALRVALADIPVREAQLLHLMYFAGQSLEVAGAQLGWTKSWACRMHWRAIKKLRVRLPSELRCAA